MRMRMAGWIALAFVVLALAWALYDGGEVELRQIEEPVDLPESWR